MREVIAGMMAEAEGDRLTEAPSKDCLRLKHGRDSYWPESVS